MTLSGEVGFSYIGNIYIYLIGDILPPQRSEKKNMSTPTGSPDYLTEVPIDAMAPAPVAEEVDPMLQKYQELIGIERVSWPHLVVFCQSRL